MPAVRRKARRLWPRAAAVALGLAGGCLSAVPPVVPPGWSVHFHQETPYFYNENTGETTWEQPRPITTTAAAAAATAAGTEDRALPPSRRDRDRSQQHPPARGDGRPSPSPSPSSAGGGTKRSWFGFARNAAKPPEQHQQQRHQKQRWEDQGARPQERWQAAGDRGRGWGLSADGIEEREGQEERSAPVAPAPAAYATPQHGWEAERGAGAWGDPLAGSGSPGGAKVGGRGATGDDGEDLMAAAAAAAGQGVAGGGGGGGGGGEGAHAAGGGAGGSSAGGAAEEEFLSPRPGGVGGDRGALGAVEERASGEHDGWWGSAAGSAAGGGGVAPESSGVGVVDAVPAAAGGDAQGEAHDPIEQPSEGGGEGTLGQTVAPSTAAGAPAAAASAAAAAKAAKEGTENERAAPPAAGDTMSEWFLPSQRHHHHHHHHHQEEVAAAAQETAAREHSGAAPAWKELDSGDGDGVAVPDGRAEAESEASPGGRRPGAVTVAASAGGGNAEGADGADAFALEQENRFSDSQHDQQQQQHQQQAYGAEGWDWADPWGQADTWGAPAWKTGTDGAPKEQPEQPSASASAAAGAGSGWGYSGVGGEQPDTAAGFAGEAASTATHDAAGAGAGAGAAAAGGSSSVVGAPAAGEVMRQEEEAAAAELARALAETRTELEEAREAEVELRTALKEVEGAKAAALAAAAAAAEKTAAAEALARRQAEEAKENATAAGQWLVTLGLEREELRGQLAAAETNSTSLLEELSAVKESAVELEIRANSSEAKLKVALEDVEVLDEGLKLFMDGDGQRHRSPRPAPLSWRRVSDAYLRPLLPSKLKAPTPEELEALKLNRSLGRALENNTALAEAVNSKDDLVKDLNSRIKQFQLHAVRRKKGYRALKLGLAKLTDEVQAKESMLTILAVCMFGTSSILESMAGTLENQQANIADLAELSREREEKVKTFTAELESGAILLTDLRESLHKTESALSAVAASFGANEDCVQRWKDTPASGAAPGQAGDDGDGPLRELLHELHAAAANKFLSPLGLEPSTGAITVAVPRTPVDVGVGDRGRKAPGFWAGVLDVLCCRRRAGGGGGGGRS